MSVPRRVLLVDDDLAMRLRVGDLLRSGGQYALHEAEDGPAGLQAAQMLLPDLILLDLMLPGMSGADVCRALRSDARTREIPIIVLSAAEETEAMVASLDAGADDFLRKPVFAPELQAKVRTITGLNRYKGLQRERDRFRWLLDRSLEPLVVADARGALVYANARTREIFALPAGTGFDVASAIARSYHAEPADAWAAWRELRGSCTAFAIYRPETEQVAARWFDVELQSFDGGATETLIKFTDRSGWVRRELETFAFQRLIAHKIRTPLNGISPVLAMVTEGGCGKLPEEARLLLSDVQQSAERLEGSLLAVLRYHDAVFGRPPANAAKQWQPLRTVVHRAAGAAGLTLREREHALTGWVAHGELLEIVVAEAMENYAKFSEAPRTGIEVTARAWGGLPSIQFFAPGPRVPPEFLAQLARPYAQLERRFSGEVPGMGLGLATARLLLRSAGGDLHFSEAEGGSGVVTTAVLPREDYRTEEKTPLEQRACT